jgi:HlyD family secretion protein
MKIYNLIIYSIILIQFSCNNAHQQSDAYGNFEAREIFVASEANGKITSFTIEEGDECKEGEVAGVIDSSRIHLKKQQLLARQSAIKAQKNGVRAQVGVLEEQKENLLREKNRVERLIKDDAATQKQLDDIQGETDVLNRRIESTKSQYKVLESEIKSVDQQIAEVNVEISNCIIKVPVDGTVLVTYAEQGEFTTMGKNLFKIADLSTLYLRVYVSETQLPKIERGQEVQVLIDKSATEYIKLKGEISWISSSAEFTPKIIQTKEERVNLVYAVKVKVPNDGRLKIGMPGEVKF